MMMGVPTGGLLLSRSSFLARCLSFNSFADGDGDNDGDDGVTTVRTVPRSIIPPMLVLSSIDHHNHQMMVLRGM